MNNKNIKVIDEHNIDRNANVMFGLELEGSEYVTYCIERDVENSNIFISKVIKNVDGTYNMMDIEDTAEKSKLTEILKSLITNAVESQNDKLVGNSVTLADGKVVKFIPVSFNKEQRLNVQKTYVTTVKKEVVRVAEKYYYVEVVLEQPKVEESIFPTIPSVTDSVNEVFPDVPVMPTPVVAPAPVVVEPVVETPVVAPAPVVPEPVVPEPVAVQPTPIQVVPTEVTPTPVVTEISVAEPTVVQPVPEPAAVVMPDPNQPLVFNASKETNLNAALGEVASTTTILVENIQPVRDFGVDTPVQSTPVVTPAVAPMQQPEVSLQGPVLTKKAGFANSKFFMVVAVAFFLASCIFLGYEVFSYFQITK